MGFFSNLKRGVDKKKKSAKYRDEQPGVVEKDILNQAFLGDDPYLRVGAPAKLFPGNDSIRPHDYRTGSPGSDNDSLYGTPANGSGHASNNGSRQPSPAMLQPPQFSQFGNHSAQNLPSRPWSSSTNTGPGDERPSTAHGPGTKQWGSNSPMYESHLGPVHRRTDTQGTAAPASRPGSHSGSVVATPQSPLSPALGGRRTDSQTSTLDKNLSTSSVSPTENSETSQNTSATATTTSDADRATSPPSTVSDQSRPSSSAGKVWPLPDGGNPVLKDSTPPAPASPASPASPKDTRARDTAKRRDLAIKVPRRRSWSAQINQLEKAWLEEQLNQKRQNGQKEPTPTPLSAQPVAEEQNEKDAAAPQTTPLPPTNTTAALQAREQQQQQQQQQRVPQDLPQQRQDMPRQSPRMPQGPMSQGPMPQGPMPSPRRHMPSQSAQQFPTRRGPPPSHPANGRSVDHGFAPRFDPRNMSMSRNDPRGDPRFDSRGDSRPGSRQGPPRPWPQQGPSQQQMPQSPTGAGPRDRGRVVDYDFMPSTIDQYGGAGGGPYAMGRTSRIAPPGVNLNKTDAPMAAPRSVSGGMPRGHRKIPSDIDIDISVPIDVGGRMPETRLPAVLRGSQSMQQLPRLPRETRGPPVPMVSPGAAQNPYHMRAGSMVSQGSQYNRGYAHPQQQHGMRSASVQGMRSPQYPVPLPAAGMREGGSRYPMGGPGAAGPNQGPGLNQGPGPGPGPGPRRLLHSSSADLTVYRDQHHQYGPMRSPMGLASPMSTMSSPGYGPGPRPGSSDQAGRPSPQFNPSMDRRSLDPRADNRADPRYNLPSPVSPGAYDRQLADVAEDIEEKSVFDMPGVAVKDFADKKDATAPTADTEVLTMAPRVAQSMPSGSPPLPESTALAVAPVESVEPVTEAAVEAAVEAEVLEKETVEPVVAVQKAIPEPVAPKTLNVETAPTIEQAVPQLSSVEPTRSTSPVHAASGMMDKSGPMRPISTFIAGFPLTPVTPTAEKLPLHAPSSLISLSRAADAPAPAPAPARSYERSQAIAERRRTRFPTRDSNTPPDTPILDLVPPSPVGVAPVTQVAEDVEDEEKDEAADVLSDAAAHSSKGTSRSPSPIAESAEAEDTAQFVDAVEVVEAVHVEAIEPIEPETVEAAPIVEMVRFDAEAAEAGVAAAVPAGIESIESSGDDIVETVVSVHRRSGGGATSDSSPLVSPVSPMSPPAGDAERSADANWPLPSVFVSPASRPVSPISPVCRTSRAASPASPASIQRVPTIVMPDEAADTKSIDDSSSEDENDLVDEEMPSTLPSPTRKTAFTASIYAKDIGIGPYAFEDATAGAMDKRGAPTVESRAAREASVASDMAWPATPTRANATGDLVAATPESTYSWAGDEAAAAALAAKSARQSDVVAVADKNAAALDALETPAPAVHSMDGACAEAETKEAGLMHVAPESIGLARGPSILADIDISTLSPRGKRRWNIVSRRDSEMLQERLMDVAASPVVGADESTARVSTSPTPRAKKGPPPPLASVPLFNRHVPTDVKDKFGTTFI